MHRFSKFFEYGYLVIAAVFTYEGVSRWNTESSKAYLMLGFAVVAVFMYFFKRKFRKGVEKRNKR